MTKEFKIGILAVVVVAVSIWGYKFILGRNILTRSTTIYVEYSNVGEIRESTPVYVKGLQVGVVTSIYPRDRDMKSFFVVIQLDKGIYVPKDAVVEIRTNSVMGSKALEIVFDKGCEGDCAVNGDTLRGVTLGMLRSMVDSSEAAMFLTLMSDKMTGLVDSVSGSINDPNNPNSINRTYMDLRATIANLKSISGKIDNILAGSAGNVKQITNNLEKLSATLSKSENRINSILGNLDTTTANLKQVNLAGTVEKAEDAMASVEKTLNSASTTFAELEVIISNIRKGEGTLGKLIVDEKLYEQLDATLLQIEKLTEDLKLHPKRYTRILSKKEIPYQPAEEKNN